MDSCKQIYKYLIKQNNQVVELITRGQHINQLESLLFPLINQYVKGSWQLGGYEQNELTIVVNSSLQANQLRLNANNIINDINKLENNTQLTSIRIKVAPVQVSAQIVSTPIKLRQQSDIGWKNMASLAELIDDPNLKSSINKLARTLKRD